jgi:hypothetical protein
MVELDLKYCPKCNDEYRAEIEKCASCGVILITGAEKIAQDEERKKKFANRVTELSPDDDLVGLQRGPLSEMRHLEALLDREHIATLLLGDDKSCGQSCCPTVYTLLVRREDAQEAFDIMAEEHKKATGLDYHDNSAADNIFNPEAGVACCPACGHTFSTTAGTTCPDCGLNFG